MDPVGSWSAYAASYNRLANAGSFQNPPGGDLHPHMGGGVQPPQTTTSQLLAAHATSAASPFNPAGFLSPPPVSYDAVFPPLFHQKAHYGIQHRPLKQPEADSYNQMAPNNYFDQNSAPSLPWSQNNAQLPSPFGILPHESVVPNSSGGSPKSYENFNVHFAAAQSLNQLNSQIPDYKSSSFIDPKKRSMSPLPKTPVSTPFFQQTFSSSETSFHFKQNDYSLRNFHNGNVQQTCGIPPAISQGKEHRAPLPIRPQFPQQRNEKLNYASPKINVHKVPGKIFESEKRIEYDSQSSPISFAMIDAQRNYQSPKLRNQQFQNVPTPQTYRFPMTPESDYQRSKSTESFGSASSNPDCNIGLTRRPSPIQAHTSPNNISSPIYPMYNSPLTTISSPSPVQHESCFNKLNDITPPLDVSVPRTNISYSSVITRTDVRFDRQDYSRQPWDDRQRRYPSYENTNGQNRQQYFDPSHQVSLQDLSSCRGDPMSLVKTLQQQQPEKVLEDKSKKRRKSVDKSSETDYFPRVPPPAHHNTNQPNQNGYFDSERWNLAPPNAKIFPSSPATYGSQPTMGSNFSNQHQSLMVPHPGLPLPYFSSLSHVTPVQPSEVAAKPEIETVQPKVIVPNIEDELQCFLQNGNDTEDLISRKKSSKSTNSFIYSFEKFLHGVKESSPPPDLRPVRRMIKPKIYDQIENNGNETLNVELTSVPEFPSDPQDDPRYFPLPKSSDQRTFDSSDSDDNSFLFNSKVDKKIDTPPPTPLGEKDLIVSKEEKSNESGLKIKKKRKKDTKKKIQKQKKDSGVLPRREISLRKAKVMNLPLIDVDIGPENYVPELQNSDLDPAWDPLKKGGSADRKKVKKSKFSNKTVKTIILESSDEDDLPLANRVTKQRKTRNPGQKKKKTTKTMMPHIISPSRPSSSSKSNHFPFKIGEFVVLKTDLCLRHPPLWRVKEKTMLQKFLHTIKNGVPLYQNIPSYSGWSPESKNVYEGVTVKVVSIVKHDMLVQLLSTEIQESCLTLQDRSDIEAAMELSLKFQDNFEVYVQTLFSQALDSNFLTEIFQDKDEYFLSNVRAVDDYISELEKRFISVVDWSESFVSAVQLYSSYRSYPRSGTVCRCGAPGTSQFILTGTNYDKDTLQKKNEPVESVEAPLCRTCLSNVEVFHSLCHFKCSLYGVCEQEVLDKREAEPNKDTTVVLNELLADDVWLNQVFKSVRKDWGYAELVIERLRKALQAS